MYKYKWSNLVWLLVSAVIFIADQCSKTLARNKLVYMQPVALCPHLNLTLMYNTGAAFSFLGNAGGWQLYLFLLLAITISLLLILWLLKLKNQISLSLALALIIGGALGNAYDRFIFGHVTDFIDFYIKHWHWPAFNIADSAICVGAAIVILTAF
jgi:signal peptidase II